MGAETLFEDSEMVVRAQPGRPGMPVLVSFGHLARRPEEPGFWAATLATAMGWPAIGFVARRPNWFPAPSMDAAAAVVRERLDAMRPADGAAIGYGYSMGGHAVLRHGRMLGLENALAVSPQASILPADLSWDMRFRAYLDPVRDAGMMVRAGDAPARSWILADLRHPEDSAHARLLEGLGARAIHTPWMNHNPIQLLNDRVVTETALRAVMTDDAAALRRALRERRHASPFWQAGFGAALVARGREGPGTVLLGRAVAAGLRPTHVAEALAEAMRAKPSATAAVLGPLAALGGLDAGAWTDLCNQMAAAGHRREALAVAEAGYAAVGPQAVLLVQLGHLRLAEGQLESGRAALEAAVALDPGEGWAWVGLSLARLRAGDAVGGEAAGREGVRLRPGDPAARLQWAAALMVLGRFAEAANAYAAAMSLGGGAEAEEGLRRARQEEGRAGRVVPGWIRALRGR